MNKKFLRILLFVLIFDLSVMGMRFLGIIPVAFAVAILIYIFLTNSHNDYLWSSVLFLVVSYMFLRCSDLLFQVPYLSVPDMVSVAMAFLKQAVPLLVALVWLRKNEFGKLKKLFNPRILVLVSFGWMIVELSSGSLYASSIIGGQWNAYGIATWQGMFIVSLLGFGMCFDDVTTTFFSICLVVGASGVWEVPARIMLKLLSNPSLLALTTETLFLFVSVSGSVFIFLSLSKKNPNVNLKFTKIALTIAVGLTCLIYISLFALPKEATLFMFKPAGLGNRLLWACAFAVAPIEIAVVQ